MQLTLALLVTIASALNFQVNGKNDLKTFCNQQNGVVKAAGKQTTNPGEKLCSQTELGLIPDVGQMVSTIITSPADGGNVNGAQGFSISFSTQGLVSGFLQDPATQFMAFPQTLDPATGRIQGGSSISCQALPNSNQVPEAQSVAFQALANDATTDGAGKTSFTVAVPPGAIKSKGLHRCCTLAFGAGLTPVIMPVAQRGAQDDCIRIQVQ